MIPKSFKFTLVICFLYCFQVLQAEGTIGTSGADFLEIGVSPRALALGGAYSATADDLGAIYYNPAAIGMLTYRQFGVSHHELIEDSRLEHISGLVPLKFGTKYYGNIYIGQTLFWVPTFDKIDEYGEKDGDVSFVNSATGVGYGYRFNNFALGVTSKYVFQQIDQLTTHSLAVDAGVMGAFSVYAPFSVPAENLFLGFSILNIGTTVDSDPLPRSFRFGISYLPINWIRINLDLHESLIESSDLFDFTYGFDESFGINSGIEYNYQELIFFRAGYAWNDGTTYSFGTGFNYAVGRTAFTVDLALQNTESFGYTFAIHIGVMLVPKVTAQDKQMAEQHYMRGIKYYVSDDLDNAIESFKKARSYNPYYKNIDKKLEELEDLKDLKEENNKYELE